MHDDSEEVDGGHTVRSKGVRCNCVCAVLETSSNNEKNGNQTGLNKESGLKEDTTKDRIRNTEGERKLSVTERTNV